MGGLYSLVDCNDDIIELHTAIINAISYLLILFTQHFCCVIMQTCSWLCSSIKTIVWGEYCFP